MFYLIIDTQKYDKTKPRTNTFLANYEQITIFVFMWYKLMFIRQNLWF